MRRHRPTNTARIVLNGKVHSLGRWASHEARMRYDTLIAAYVTSGRTSIEGAKPSAAHKPPTEPAGGVRAVTAPPPGSCQVREPVAGLTVGELAVRYLRHIEQTKPNYRRSSLWHGALAASRAVRSLAAMPASAFGSRALTQVQEQLIETPAP
ncbi:MAG: hypothetical protein ACKOES_03250, partial [Planctomycetaceae bacterium]